MDDPVSVALRESEELYRITLLNMSDAVFITDDDGVFTFICPNVDVIFGYGHDEVRAMDRISRLLGQDLIDREQLDAHGEIQNIEHEGRRSPRAARAHQAGGDQGGYDALRLPGHQRAEAGRADTASQ